MNSKNNILNIFVFTEGFLVLSLQIFISVVLTPYWGQTYYYWVYSLFLSMLGLGIGYFLTPILLQKTGGALPLLKKIGTYLVLYFSITVAFSLVILNSFLDLFTNPLNGAIFSLILFFFIPTLLLAMIPMTLIAHLKQDEKAGEGESSGRIFSMSAAGGIAGVFLVTYIILPYMGLTAVVVLLIAGFSFLYLIIAKTVGMKSAKWIPVVVAAFCLLVYASQQKSHTKKLASHLKIVHETDGILGSLTVLENSLTQKRQLLVNNNIQSEAHFTGRSMNPYVYSVAMYTSYLPKGSNVLIAGLGCGSLAYEYGELGYKVDVVDIDQRLDDIVQEHFLVSKNAYNFKHSDARRYFKSSDKKYDAIVLDISHGENIPTNVYTLEGFREVKNDLSEDGLLLVHFLAGQTDDGKMALASVIHTMEEAGLDVEIMDFLNRRELFNDAKWGGKAEGFILAGKKRKVDLERKQLVIDPSLLAEMHPNKDSLYLSFSQRPTPQLLTDDRPILDLFHSETAMKFRMLSIALFKEAYKHE